MDETRRCTATAKGTGERCKRAAVVGLNVCVKHGGGAPRAQAAAARRRQQQAVSAALADWESTFGPLELDSTEADPAAAVLEQIRWAGLHVAWLRARVQSLEPGDLVAAGRPHAVIEMYGRERDRLVKACEIAARMGVEERLVRATEQQVQLFADVLARVFADPELALTPGQQTAAKAVTARHLRLVAGGTGGR